MSETIGFRTHREFLGRNGLMKMAGILIERQGDDIYLAPLTSKLQIGRAYMLVPVEMAGIVAEALLRVSGALQAKRTAA